MGERDGRGGGAPRRPRAQPWRWGEVRCPMAAIISRSPALRISEVGSRRTTRGYASAPVTTSASAQPEPPQLAVEVRARPPLAAALGDRVAELEQARLDHIAPGPPAASLAFLQPGGRRRVATRAVVAAASGDLVLRPRRPALESRDHVLERGLGEPGLERPPAPHALGPVALDDPPQPLGARQARV